MLWKKRCLTNVAVLGSISAANNTALDSSVHIQSSAPMALPGLTTTAAGIIIVFVAINNDGTGMTVVGSTLGSFTRRAFSGTLGGAPILEFSAPSSGSLTSEVITITAPNAIGGFCEAVAFGVKGVNTGTNSGFDSNGGLPVTATSSPVLISTSNANDFIFFGARNGGNQNSLTGGFIDIFSAGGNFVRVAYKIVTTTQSSLSAADPSASTNGMIGDALIST